MTEREIRKGIESGALIPKIFFPGGKPIDEEKKGENDATINEAYATSPSGLAKADFEIITKKLFEIPKFFTSLLFDRLK